jgi:branched-chain amino acid transport system ATP-binding protein
MNAPAHSTKTAMLAVDGLVVKYGGIEALHGVSMRVHAGEIVGVLGPNGAGKSSAMNGLMGLVRPARGSVVFEGSDIAGLDTEAIVRKGLVLVPERRRLFGRMSVRDNLTLGAAARKDKAAARDDLDRVMDLFPVLRERLEQQAGLLSGGEAQQLAIARAVMSGPRLLLLDEPSLGLAPLLVDKVFALVQTLRDEGLTILIVEQNAYQVLEFADRAYVLRNGAVVDEGTGAELLEREDLRAQYLGSDAPAPAPAS